MGGEEGTGTENRSREASLSPLSRRAHRGAAAHSTRNRGPSGPDPPDPDPAPAYRAPRPPSRQLVPKDAQVEITAKVFHGYEGGAAYTVDAEAMKATVGRDDTGAEVKSTLETA